MITVSKTFEFAASHQLRLSNLSTEENERVFGKCATRHGHNYRLEVTVSGPLEATTGMIVDARDIERLVQEQVFQDVDHKDLDHDVSWLRGVTTTVEAVADAIWKRLEPPFAALRGGVQLERIRLWETGRIFAERTR